MDIIYLYHQIWRTLLRGDDTPNHKRRPLPAELVHLISRLADLRVPDSTRAFVHSEGIHVSSHGPFETKLWFCTSPFDDTALNHLAAFQLLTTPNDQGWAIEPDKGSWTWFEWGIFANAAEATAQATVKSESGEWMRSHSNVCARSEPQRLSSSVVAVDDDMWKGVVEGSVIAVRACAMYPGWSNYARQAEVKIWKWFEPAM